MAKKTFWVILIPILLIFTFSCSLLTDDNPPTPTPTIKTILWQPDENGASQFYTNDNKYLGIDGWTFWTWDDLIEDPMTYVETEIYKVSGDPLMGFGVIFCLQDSENYLTLIIATDGYYMIAKLINGVSNIIVDWTYSSSLLQGYNATNKIKVENIGQKKFRIYFNDTEIGDFTDNLNPTFTGGKYGFIASISADEDFPDVPVDIRFKQVKP